MINENSKKKPKITSNYTSINDNKKRNCMFVCTIRTLIKIVFFISIRNGAERSGLYCLCSIAIDRINSDGTVAMPLMLNHLRSRRKQLVPYFVS